MNALARRAAALAALDSPSAFTLGIDFDSVLHNDNQGWRGGEVYGDPMPGAIEALESLLWAGWHVFVLTARHPRHHQDVAAWLDKHLNWTVLVDDQRQDLAYWHGPELLVTNRKLGAVVYLDDKAERFTTWATALLGLPPAPGQPPALVPTSRFTAPSSLWHRLLDLLDLPGLFGLRPAHSSPDALADALDARRTKARNRRASLADAAFWRLQHPVGFQPGLVEAVTAAADTTAHLYALAAAALAHLDLNQPDQLRLYELLVEAAQAGDDLETRLADAALYTTGPSTV